MASQHGTITGNAPFELCTAEGAVIDVDCSLFYKPADPYAVLASFRLGDQQVSWIFARSLLADGMYTRTGDGDVVVHPGTDEDAGCVYIDLNSTGHTARLRTATSQLWTFLNSTYVAVPEGNEAQWLRIEEGLDALLA